MIIKFLEFQKMLNGEKPVRRALFILLTENKNNVIVKYCNYKINFYLK